MHRFFTTLFFLVLFSSVYFPENKPENKDAAEKDSVKVYNLSDIVITANKFSAPLLEVASSVTILNEAEIQRSNKSLVSEVLRDVPGLSIAQQGGPGKVTRIFVRGANPHHTLVMLDGVEMNDPGSITNAFDISNLQTDNIERIEVLRGPQSTLYGSDAMAGVVSIFTKRGTGSPKLSLSAEGGSYETYKGNANLNGGYGVLDYSLNYSRLYSGGFSSAGEKYGNTEKDSYLNNSAASRIGLNLSDYINLDFSYRFTKAESDLDQNSMKGDDPNFSYNLEESLFRSAANVSLFDNRWNQVFSFSLMKNINSTLDEEDILHPGVASHNYYTGKRYRYDWQNNVRLFENNTVSFGIEAEEEIGYSSYEGKSEWGPFVSEFPSANAYTTGVYLQDQLNLFGSFFANAGMRYDKHNRFGSVFTYRFAPAYYLSSTSTKLKATYGTGFKSPSLYHLFDPAYGNKDLQPEKSRGWDAGFEQYLLNHKLTIGAAYFNNSFENLIGYDSNFKTVNIDKALTHGVELFVTAAFKNASVNINYTYTDSKDKSEGKEDSGKDLLRRPRNKFGAGLTYAVNSFGSTIEMIAVGKREDKNFDVFPAARVELSPYALINISGWYNISKHIKLFGRVDNLFDADYEEVLFYGTPGINGTLGVKFSIL